jgi:class 3 adenylate cyclase
MRCSKCGTNNPSTNNFCGKCGNPLAKLCTNCKANNPATSAFCGNCGTPLGHAGVAAATSPPPAAVANVRVTPEQNVTDAGTLEGERKTVTALFADIKGSTELMEELDPEEAGGIVDPALRLMIDAVRHYDGYVVQSTGDGIFALFGAPVAHEDHPLRALYSALRMQDQLRQYAAELRAEGKAPIAVRVGVNTGEVVVRSIRTGDGHTEYTPIGHTTNLASRIQNVAMPGSVVVSENTRKLCEGYFLLKPLGATKVRGVSGSVNVYEVNGLGPLRTRLQRSAGRGLTKFVGREHEIKALRHAADQATAGQGEMVAAVAGAGVGKSRLYYEFKALAQSNWLVLETFSISHGKASAFLPVIDLLRNYFRIGSEDDERTRREKVAGKIAILDRSLEDTLPYFYSLLGIVEGADPLAQMDGQIKKRRTLEAIKRIALRESLNQPLMIIFEDLHWMDIESQALLDALVDSIADARILLLVNYRPEYSHQWNSKSYYTQLRLDPLGQESADEMLSSLLGNGDDLTALKRLIIEKTEGNPFFIEEIVQNLIEEGALLRNGEIKLARPLNAIQIPPLVQAILAARIDRLPADEKELLQTLAVLGKEFTLSQLKTAAAKSDSELKRLLANLQLAEFIYEQPADNDVEYTFKHALTQEVAYNSILFERRKQIHEHAAHAIEVLFAASLADHYDDLAHHYGRSGNAPKAISYLRLGAQQAMSRSAYVEARDQLAAALDLLSRQPDTIERDRAEIAVRINLALCTTFVISDGLASTAVSDILEGARELCQKIGDDARLFEVLENLSFQFSGQFELAKARTLGNELLRIALRTQNPEMVGRARFDLGRTSMWLGDFVAARKEFDQASELTVEGMLKEETSFGNWQVRNRSLASLTLWISGFPDRAMVTVREAFLIASEKRASPADLIFALYWSAVLNLRLGDPLASSRQSNEAIRLIQERGLMSFLELAGFWRGWALAQSGQVAEGLAEMQRSRMGFATAAGLIRPLIFEGLASVYLANGHRSEGLKEVNEALELIERSGSMMVEAELRRLKGELLLLGNPDAAPQAAESFREAIEVARPEAVPLLGNSDAARLLGNPDAAPLAAQSFREAIELARRQSAKSWELRATTSLARLLASQGRHDEARTMLTDIYNWFTEGFATADLKTAKTLLDELTQ